MTISKSTGVTKSERLLTEFCERSFLKLWSYANPYKDDGNELCDLLAVFGEHVFVFFDREKQLPAVPDKDPQVLWDRWKRNVIDRQVRTAHGAERYIRSGRAIFLDAKRATPFPLDISTEAAIHKIIVAHGAKEACEQASEQNVYGSLAISYCESDWEPTPPFHVEIDKSEPVHIFDSHNLSIVLSELDTVTDFSNYLIEKTRAVGQFDSLMYCGEEDLLAHYFLGYDEDAERYVIGPKDGDWNAVMIGEGEWHDFIESDVYKSTRNENRISYFWDELLQRTCQHALDGTVLGNADLFRGPSAIFEMVKEPRFIRRALSAKMLRAVENFPDTPGQYSRQVTFMPSFTPNLGYVFLQIGVPKEIREQADFREKRAWLLQIACGAAKNKFPHLEKVVGIGVEAPKLAQEGVSEDFVLLPCESWPDEMRAYYEEQNRPWQFFETEQLESFEERVTQFVQPAQQPAATAVRSGRKIGRNEPCPCGSGKKYKKCHGA